MIEAVMLWNEPNNLSHWDFELDPEWQTFSTMTRLAADAVRSVAPDMPCVLGGISPIDPLFVERMNRQLRHYEKVRYRWRQARAVVRFVALAVDRQWQARRQAATPQLFHPGGGTPERAEREAEPAKAVADNGPPEETQAA